MCTDGRTDGHDKAYNLLFTIFQTRLTMKLRALGVAGLFNWMY